VRNGSQKEISLGSNTTLVFNLVSNATNDLALQKDCAVVDIAKGRYQVILTESEMFKIEAGYYSFTLVAEQRTNIDSVNYSVTTRQVLYTDDQYSGHGTIEVLTGATGEIYPSAEIVNFNKVDPAATGDEDRIRYESGIIDGRSTVNRANSTHTFQLYMTQFTGTVIVQGSLDSGGAPSNWSNLHVDHFEDRSESYYVNIRGKYSWFRIIYIPQRDPAVVPYYVYGTGTGDMGMGLGYYYPLYLNKINAEEADDGSNTMLGAGAHLHTFEEYPDTDFFMPNNFLNHAKDTPPDEDYILYGYNAEYYSLANTSTDEDYKPTYGSVDKILYR